MNQSSAIAAALLISFIVFITIRGELRQYLDVLGIDLGTASPSTTGTTTGTSAGFGSAIPNLPSLGSLV